MGSLLDKGLEGLQVAILIGIVTAAAAILATSILRSTPKMHSAGVANVVLALQHNGTCDNFMEALKPIYKNIKIIKLNSTADLAIFVRIIQPGLLQGVKLETKSGLTILPVKKTQLSSGLYLLCLVSKSPKTYSNVTNVELVGFVNLT